MTIFTILLSSLLLLISSSDAFAVKKFAVEFGSNAPLQVAPQKGAATSGNCIQYDANGNIVDAGAPCGSGSGGSGNVGIGTATWAAYYPANGSTVVANSNLRFVGSNVGIGSAAPGAQLDVQGQTRIYSGSLNPLNVNFTGAVTGQLASFGNVTSGEWGGISNSTNTGNPFQISSSGSHDLQLCPGANCTIVMNASSQNMGIGSSIPGQKLTVAGRVYSTSGGFQFPDNTTQTTAASGTVSSGTINQVAKYAATGTTISGSSILTDTGTNIGISATSPAAKLDVNTGADSHIVFGPATGAATYNAFSVNGILGPGRLGFIGGATGDDNIYVDAGTTGDVLFRPNGLPKMIIKNSTGNVGIGTLSPPNLLYVAGTAEMQGFKMPLNPSAGYVLTSNTVGVGTWMPSSGGSGSGTVNSGVASQVARYASTGTAVSGSTLVYDDLTNVGIGTVSPVAKLNISSTANQDLFRVDDNATNDLSPFVIDMNGNVGIGTTNTQTDKLLVMGGNVGIGTWVPNQTLDVKGKVIISDNVGIGTVLPVALLSVASTAAQDLFRVDDNATGDVSPFLIDQNGNVGVGTTVVTSNLNVAGYLTINVSGTLSPAQGGTYTYAGQVNGADYYTNGSYFLWKRSNETQWIISNATTEGSLASAFWFAPATNGIMPPANGWSTGSGSTGTPVITEQNIVNMAGRGNIIFTNSGLVGIGTTMPQYPLEVVQVTNNSTTFNNIFGISAFSPSTGLRDTMRFSMNANTSRGGAWCFGESGGAFTNTAECITATLVSLNFAQEGNFPITFTTNSNTRMTIDGGGNVGIGIAPTSKLDVLGGVSVGASYAGLQVAPTNGLITQGNIGVGTFTANGRLMVSGNVGIGTLVAGQALTIGGAGNKLRMQDANGISWTCGPAITTGVFTCTNP